MKPIYIKIFLYTTLLLIILSSLIFFFRYRENNRYIERGESLINKIEAYRSEHKRLPNNVEELRLIEPMNEGPYYEKKDSLNYVVYFNIGFDDTKIYYSKTKEWKDEH